MDSQREVAVDYDVWQNSLGNSEIVEEVDRFLNQLEIPEEKMACVSHLDRFVRSNKPQRHSTDIDPAGQHACTTVAQSSVGLASTQIYFIYAQCSVASSRRSICIIIMRLNRQLQNVVLLYKMVRD